MEGCSAAKTETNCFGQKRMTSLDWTDSQFIRIDALYLLTGETVQPFLMYNKRPEIIDSLEDFETYELSSTLPHIERKTKGVKVGFNSELWKCFISKKYGFIIGITLHESYLLTSNELSDYAKAFYNQLVSWRQISNSIQFFVSFFRKMIQF